MLYFKKDAVHVKTVEVQSVGKMKIIIAGSRDFDNYELLDKEVSSILNSMVHIPMSDIELVSGTARGADKLGERYAKENNFNLKLFPADWNNLGKSAGYIRNENMAKYSDVLIAFWDEKSKGTKHMIDLAIKYNLKVHIIKFK